MILHRGIPAERGLVEVRHPVLVGIDRRGGGVQRADAAVAHAGEVGFAGDVVARLGDEILDHLRVHLIAQRPGGIDIEPQRAGLRDDFFESHHRVVGRHRDAHRYWRMARAIHVAVGPGGSPGGIRIRSTIA